MRAILLLKGDAGHYVLDERPTADADFLIASLATGGEVRVPRENVLAVEVYGDEEMASFRYRLQHTWPPSCSVPPQPGAPLEHPEQR